MWNLKKLGCIVKSLNWLQVLKVAILAEKYAVDYTWYVDTILNLIRIAGDYVSEEVSALSVLFQSIVTNNSSNNCSSTRLPLRYWRPSWTAFIDRLTSAANSSHQYYVWRQSVFCRWSSCLERSSCRLARSCTERTDILRTVENVLVCLTAAHLMLKVRLINHFIIIIIILSLLLQCDICIVMQDGVDRMTA